jgi:cytochrome b561
MPNPSGYSITQIALHWITAVLIVWAYFVSEGMGKALDARLTSGATGTSGNTAHVWVGGAVVAFVLIRLAVRIRTGAPQPEPHAPTSVQRASVWGHRVLYALMIATPFLGAVTWYGGIQMTGEVHAVLGNMLMIFVAGHVIMAMLHQPLFGHGVLSRMFTPRN